MITCTECGEEIQTNRKFLVGVFVTVTRYDRPHLPSADHIIFNWGCEHEPRESADVHLSSRECVEAFLRRHPEHTDRIIEMMSEYTRECTHYVQ